MELKFSLKQVEDLLIQQKELVIEKLRGQSSYYNKESTDGHLKTLPIDEAKFKQAGMTASFPSDILTIKRYVDQSKQS